MFRKRDKGSTSGRAQAKGRAELQRQVEERLFYWRLFLEAKLEEVHERRNPAGLFTEADTVEEQLLETLLSEEPPAVVEEAEPEPRHHRLF
jgi:hypothetical protein